MENHWFTGFVLLVTFFHRIAKIDGKKTREIDINYVDNGQHNTKWFLLHYHKTGHDIVNHISNVFAGNDCNADIVRLKIGRNSLDQHMNKVQGADIIPLAGVDMQFYWIATFGKQTQHINKVLHFVRNPFDMVISGYLYHSQIPPPPIEHWITREGFDMCQYNHDVFMSKYAPKLGELRGGGENGTQIVRKMFNDAAELCKSMTKKYNNAVYSHVLTLAKKNVDVMEAIRLEALRSLLHIEGGDIVRMGVNCMYEDKRLSKRVFTNQFPIGDRDRFLNTTVSVFDFLMNRSDENLTPKPFWTCITRQKAVERTEKAAFIPTIPQDTAGTHITAGMISSESRHAYIEQLRKDRIIGPLLTLVEEAIQMYN